MARTIQWPALVLAIGSLARSVASKDCPGYSASNVERSDYGLTADLTLAGKSCDLYGDDIQDLRLIVEYQTDSRLHVLIQDAAEQVYQIPENVITRPPNTQKAANASDLAFDLVEEPFSFSVSRRASGEVLFNTSGASLIFESQYLKLRTVLPKNPNIYGLGEHSDSFRMPAEDSTYRRTMWNAEAAYIPRRTNLYGSHPSYFEHRASGTHGVLFLNSNGMDIKFNNTDTGSSLEYNTIGGVLDFYFFSGPDPTSVTQQHAEALGLPVMMPYWSLGFHQAKYGYNSIGMLEEVVANYSKANIPLEVIWADIDYMQSRRDFTIDNKRFDPNRTRTFVGEVQGRGQHFVMILDPGISNDRNYSTYVRGAEIDAFLKADDGSDYRGIQWAGEVVWPDYASPAGADWWRDEIERFFDPETGYNIDGIWIDMNEASNFCGDVSCDPSSRHALATERPDEQGSGRAIAFSSSPGASDQAPLHAARQPSTKRAVAKAGDKKGLPGRDLFNSKYRIANSRGDLSASTIYTNVTNWDGTVQYDTHNMYGLTMAKATYRAMVSRTPGKRPFVLTRSTFLTSGRYAAHWFGDNASTWDDYRLLIYQTLGFTAVHNMPMVGSDVCGFNWPVQELMCARWATLASFLPFMRNHADISAPHQEFYLWESVSKSARKGLDARYRLLDYLYTALWRSSTTGSPSIYPLFYLYPSDPKTWGIGLQFLMGDAILVCPVTGNEAKSATFYLPDDVFYDFWTGKQVRGTGANVTLDNQDWSDIPVFYRGGTIVPQRVASANTTDELREQDFVVVVAPGLDGTAKGSLVLDDGESIEGDVSDVAFKWDGETLEVTGSFGYKSGREVASVVVLGDKGRKKRTVEGGWSLDEPFEVTV